MRERDVNVIAVVVPNKNKETILPIIQETVENDSIIMRDEYSAYKDLKFDYSHNTVNQMAHTNGIENFW